MTLCDECWTICQPLVLGDKSIINQLKLFSNFDNTSHNLELVSWILELKCISHKNLLFLISQILFFEIFTVTLICFSAVQCSDFNNENNKYRKLCNRRLFRIKDCLKPKKNPDLSQFGKNNKTQKQFLVVSMA